MRLFICFFWLLASFGTATAVPQDEAAKVQTSYFPESPQQFGFDLFYVPIHYPKYSWVNNEAREENGNAVHLGLEWMPFDTTYGKIGFGLGTGLHVIKNVNFGGTNATLTVVPVQTFVSYRFDYVKKQIVVPFLKVGTELALAKQKGIEKDGYQTYYGWEYSGGLEFCLNSIDQRSARSLDRSLGINATYLIFEYAKSAQLGARREPDLSHDELRFGLRFEI